MPAYFENGVFTDNEPFWHGLGVVDPRERLTAAEVMSMVPELASPVNPYPIVSFVPTGKFDESGKEIVDQVVAPNHVMNVREYGRKTVGIVGKRYKILQNTEAFEFMDHLIDSGEANYKTAGSLNDGRVVWMLAELPKAIQIAGLSSELANRYLLLTNSHDGSSPVSVMGTTVRVGCANTLALAQAGAKFKFKVRHTTTMKGKIAAARSALEMMNEYDEALDELARQMLSIELTDDDFRKFLLDLESDKDADGNVKEGRAATMAENKRDAISDLYFKAPNLDMVRGTAWGALNAVIEWHDHGLVGRETQQSTAVENRFERIADRPANSIIDKAAKILVPA